MNKKKNYEDLNDWDWIFFITEGKLDKSSNPLELIAFAESGVDAKRVYALKKALGWTIPEIAYCTNSNEKKLARIKNANKNLGIEDSQSIIELCFFLNSYTSLFLKNNARAANSWLFIPMKECGYKKAFDLLNTAMGRRYVLSVFAQKAVEI